MFILTYLALWCCTGVTVFSTILTNFILDKSFCWTIFAAIILHYLISRAIFASVVLNVLELGARLTCIYIRIFVLAARLARIIGHYCSCWASFTGILIRILVLTCTGLAGIAYHYLPVWTGLACIVNNIIRGAGTRLAAPTSSIKLSDSAVTASCSWIYLLGLSGVTFCALQSRCSIALEAGGVTCKRRLGVYRNFVGSRLLV